jgi:hypothetical protein
MGLQVDSKHVVLQNAGGVQEVAEQRGKVMTGRETVGQSQYSFLLLTRDEIVQLSDLREDLKVNLEGVIAQPEGVDAMVAVDLFAETKGSEMTRHS